MEEQKKLIECPKCQNTKLMRTGILKALIGIINEFTCGKCAHKFAFRFSAVISSY